MNRNVLLFALFGIGAYFLLRSNEASASQSEFVYEPQYSGDGAFTEYYPESEPFSETVIHDEQTQQGEIMSAQYDATTPEKRLIAFLDTIKAAEGTLDEPEPYRVLYGYDTSFPVTYEDHPANLGWKGVPLPDSYCRDAGLSPGCVSTAAGAYQIIKPTWNALKRKLGLTDFSPASQDAAAVELIREKGALDLVYSGNVIEAARKLSTVWASFPASTYGQGERSIAFITNEYHDALDRLG